MTERQKDELLFYIGRLNNSAFNCGFERGVEICPDHERNSSPFDYGAQHDHDFKRLLNYVNLIYEGESHEAT